MSSLNLKFQGASHEVKVYSDGQMVIHTTREADEPAILIISIRGGDTHQLSTLTPLKVKAPLGACLLAIDGGSARKVPKDKAISIAEGATFTLESTGCVLEVTVMQGPGFGKGTGDDDLLP